jgi:hypothetical protein
LLICGGRFLRGLIKERFRSICRAVRRDVRDNLGKSVTRNAQGEKVNELDYLMTLAVTMTVCGSPDEADAVALTFAVPIGARAARGKNFWREIEYSGAGYV